MQVHLIRNWVTGFLRGRGGRERRISPISLLLVAVAVALGGPVSGPGRTAHAQGSGELPDGEYRVYVVPLILTGSLEGDALFGSIVRIVNPGGAPLEVAVDFLAPDGSPSSTPFTTNLEFIPSFAGSVAEMRKPPNGSVTIASSPGMSAVAVNWARVAARGEAAVSATIEKRSPAGRLLSRLVLPGAPAHGERLLVPIVRNPEIGRFTSFAAVNPGERDAAVTATLYSGAEVVERRTVTLPARNQLSLIADEFFDLSGPAATAGDLSHVVFESPPGALDLALSAVVFEDRVLATAPVMAVGASPAPPLPPLPHG